MKQKAKKLKDFQVLPEIKLPDYRKIASEVKRKEIFIEEREVGEVIKQIQFSRAKLSLKEGLAIIGDFVEIEYSCPDIENGKEFQDAFILGRGFFISGFEEKLVGAEAGQEKNFSLKFSENHFQKDLAGKDLKFKVKTKAVKKIELPEINDDFAKNLGNFGDLNTLKKSIKEGLKSEKEMFETQRIRREILNKIREACGISFPKVLIKRERDFLLKDFKKNIPENVSFEDFLKTIKKTKEQVLSFLSETAKKRIKNSLIIREISKKEQLLTSEGEIKTRMNKILKNYSQEKTKDVDLDLLRSYIRGALIEEKVFQLLEKCSETK